MSVFIKLVEQYRCWRNYFLIETWTIFVSNLTCQPTYIRSITHEYTILYHFESSLIWHKIYQLWVHHLISLRVISNFSCKLPIVLVLFPQRCNLSTIIVAYLIGIQTILSNIFLIYISLIWRWSLNNHLNNNY